MIKAINSEEVDLDASDQHHILSANHFEPDTDARQLADLSPVADAGLCRLTGEAPEAEQTWLERQSLMPSA